MKANVNNNSQIEMLKKIKINKETNDKNRKKRILSIYSSQQSIIETAPKGTSVPLKKATKHSISNLITKTKQTKPKQKYKQQSVTVKVKPAELYQRIPMNFVHSNTCSQIEFSNYDETNNDLMRPFRKQLYIDCDQQALMKQIWKVDRKKKGLIQNEAATKIQKVFRGYLTRKLLMKYIEEYQQKLLRERTLLERKSSKIKQQEDNSWYGTSNRKSYFFPSNKKSNQKQEYSSNKQNPLDLESSIMMTENQHFASVQQNDISIKVQRKGSEAQRSSLTLNQSSIAAQPQQISLSFGQDGQPSHHFIYPTKFTAEHNNITSPIKEQKGLQISNDKTRDVISQNISNCPSYTKNIKNQKLVESHFSSLLREQVDAIQSEREVAHLQKLRSAEKAKWEQVITFVNQQMREGITQQKTKQLMSTILQFSVKNREQLNKSNANFDKAQVTPTTFTNRQLQNQIDQEKHIALNFKKKKLSQELLQQQHYNQREKLRKNQNMPLIRRAKDDKSIFERTHNLKQYFLKTMNIQDSQLDKMMQLRQAVLRRRQSNSLIQLNDLLENNQLSQQQFLERLTKLTYTFEKQKTDIQQTKNDIYQGYKAQLQLLKFTVLNAKFLGYNLPFCRSMQVFPNHPQWRFDELMIDQLNLLANRRTSKQSLLSLQQQQKLTTQKINNIMDVKDQEQDREQFRCEESQDSISFTYEETDIYKKNQLFGYDLSNSNQAIDSPKARKCILPFSRGSTISIQFDNTEQDNYTLNRQGIQQFVFPKIVEDEYLTENNITDKPACQFYQIEGSESDEQVLYKESDQNLTKEIVQYYINKLIWEAIEQIYLNNQFKTDLKLSKQRNTLQPITKQQKLSFLQTVVDMTPSFEKLQERLNQKMYPNCKQLLMSMRQVSELQDEEPEYYQIGQYQYILNQQICYQTIQNYIQVYKQQRKLNNLSIQSKRQNYKISQQLQQFGSKRLKLCVQKLQNKQHLKTQQNQELREQILKIELHLLLDSWNQELIKYRQNKNGYSGIGLNQISMSLIDRICRPMTTSSQLQQMMILTKQRLTDIIKCQQINQKLIQQYQDGVSNNDPQWILYSQQALQFGFDLTKTVEVELIFEMLQDLHKINRNQLIQDALEENQQDYFDSQISNNSVQGSNNDDPLQLNQQQQQKLQKKMLQINDFNIDSDDSFYD